jgi:pyruvate/2-oxoglutarate dehydrogenase complex dihydrolipoamide dehydrogenase (E3) component
MTDRKPRRFDANLVVIGAGAAGLVTAYVAAAAKARVVLIEQNRMGGDCLNTGCVPSKALIRAARLAVDLRRAGQFGIRAGHVSVDFPAVMAWVRAVIARIEPHDSVERYTGLGVECLSGQARLRSPWEVEVNDRRIRTRAIVIATGGRPVIPAIPGLESLPVLTSDNVWDLDRLPQRLLILGGGPIGCELAQALQRLGSAVTLVETMPQILPREDSDVAASIATRLAGEGVNVLTGWTAQSAAAHGDVGTLEIVRDGVTRRETFDRILVAAGRRAHTENLGLAELGIELRSNGTIAVDDYLQTAVPGIYACGDVTGPYQLTHAAAHQAWHCATNALFGGLRRFRVDYRALPWTVFTDPEVGRVGWSERDAREAGTPFEVTRYSIDNLDRAIAEGAAEGFVKVLTAPRSDRILGAAIVGPHAGELIGEFVTAMRHGLGLRGILGTIHAYPTLLEANRLAAGEWQRMNLPTALLGLAERYHRWRRG